jgi:hypothetical protein
MPTRKIIRPAADDYTIKGRDGVARRWVWLHVGAPRHGFKLTSLRMLLSQLPSGKQKLWVKYPSGKVIDRDYVRDDEVEALVIARDTAVVAGRDLLTAEEIYADPELRFTLPFLRRYARHPHPLTKKKIIREPQRQLRKCGVQVRRCVVWARAPLVELAQAMKSGGHPGRVTAREAIGFDPDFLRARASRGPQPGRRRRVSKRLPSAKMPAVVGRRTAIASTFDPTELEETKGKGDGLIYVDDAGKTYLTIAGGCKRYKVVRANLYYWLRERFCPAIRGELDAKWIDMGIRGRYHSRTLVIYEWHFQCIVAHQRGLPAPPEPKPSALRVAAPHHVLVEHLQHIRGTTDSTHRVVKTQTEQLDQIDSKQDAQQELIARLAPKERGGNRGGRRPEKWSAETKRKFAVGFRAAKAASNMKLKEYCEEKRVSYSEGAKMLRAYRADVAREKAASEV